MNKGLALKYGCSKIDLFDQLIYMLKEKTYLYILSIVINSIPIMWGRSST